METKEACIAKYLECKVSKNGAVPDYHEFLRFAGIDKRKLGTVFGASAYSKLQEAAGDAPNKLKLERTPLDAIMQQYGKLVVELRKAPASADWRHRGLKPSESGLSKKPHCIKWSEFPTRFVEWVAASNARGFEAALDVIQQALPKTKKLPSGKSDNKFVRLIKHVREWVPARRRNSEATYKVELRKDLEQLGYSLNEEYGESRYDLIVDGTHAIEIKRAPDLGEYDRLFGQIARHLQHQCKVLVLIFDVSSKDKYDNFISLVDKYLNVNDNSVEVIHK